MSAENTRFDYIVVGAGSSGCVVASRLSEDPKASVLLIESGRMDSNPYIHMPATFIRVLESQDTQVYSTVPQEAAKGRSMHVPQGHVVGGGSSLNAMVYIRGNPDDYNQWAQMGNRGWSWEDVLPVFKKAESNARFAGDLHGTDGPLKVSDRQYGHPLSYAFLKAAQQVGIPYNDDFNGASQEGCGFYQVTSRGGKRMSASVCYLREAEKRTNLKILTGAFVNRILFDGKRATGVELKGKDGNTLTYSCGRELVLTAGALSSPKILLLSGVGPASELKKVGVDPVLDLPGVGENYQDHLEVSIIARIHDPISLFGQDRGLTALRHGFQWQLFKTGLLTTNIVESGLFADTAGTGRPDIQFHVLPVMVGDVDREPEAGHGMSINPCFLNPRSRGKVSLRSTDPAEPALFDGGYLSDREDLETLLRGLKLARKIRRAPALEEIIKEEVLPGEQVADDDDEGLRDYIRQYSKTVYHPTGTCKMGKDKMAVVDERLRVRGLDNVRVCDASIMPTIVSGNTNAPTIMIGEQGAAFIAEDNAA